MRIVQAYVNGFNYLTVDGGWTEWSDWQIISNTCCGDSRSQTRTCTNPAPQNGGADCVGEESQGYTCETEICSGWVSFNLVKFSCSFISIFPIACLLIDKEYSGTNVATPTVCTNSECKLQCCQITKACYLKSAPGTIVDKVGTLSQARLCPMELLTRKNKIDTLNNQFNINYHVTDCAELDKAVSGGTELSKVYTNNQVGCSRRCDEDANCQGWQAVPSQDAVELNYGSLGVSYVTCTLFSVFASGTPEDGTIIGSKSCVPQDSPDGNYKKEASF